MATEKPEITGWLNATQAVKDDERGALKKSVRRFIQKPSRQRVRVNLYTLEKHTRDGDNVIVPGKLLAAGELSHKVALAAVEVSAGASAALKAAGCDMVSIEQMLKRKNVRIIT